MNLDLLIKLAVTIPQHDEEGTLTGCLEYLRNSPELASQVLEGYARQLAGEVHNMKQVLLAYESFAATPLNSEEKDAE